MISRMLVAAGLAVAGAEAPSSIDVPLSMVGVFFEPAFFVLLSTPLLLPSFVYELLGRSS